MSASRSSDQGAPHEHPHSAFGLFHLTRRDVNIFHLLESVARNQIKKVKHILKKHPHLLMEKSHVMDYAHREKFITAYQLALINGNDDMQEVLNTYFMNLHNGQEIRENQRHEIFPMGELPVHTPFDFNEIVSAIIQSTNEDIQAIFNDRDVYIPLTEALDNFRDQFAGCVRSSLRFNPYHLLNAAKIYEQQSYAWRMKQKQFFCHEVIEYLCQFAPSHYAEAFSHYFVSEEELQAEVTFDNIHIRYHVGEMIIASTVTPIVLTGEITAAIFSGLFSRAKPKVDNDDEEDELETSYSQDDDWNSSLGL